MSNLDFPSKEEADELTLSELMQAISTAGLFLLIESLNRDYWRVCIGDGKPYDGAWGNGDTPRSALDSACEEWRRRKIKQGNKDE